VKISAVEYLEEYEYLEEVYSQHQQHRGKKRPPKPEAVAEAMASLSDFNDNLETFVPSYAAALDPLHHERQWLIDSVATFYQQNMITDVTRLVKGGKEANVYCCPANPAIGYELLAAKLYRPRMLRNLSNNAIYKEGRSTLDSDGKEIRNGRAVRALKKKTRFGKHLDLMSWIVHEFHIQHELSNVGADVPKPIAQAGSAILMNYIGDSDGAAPTLNEVRLDADEARPIFERVMANIELMLSLNYVHGDLSAYNILYWEGQITIIDFPQLVDARINPHTQNLLARDVQRVCEYFGRLGVPTNPAALSMDLWERYLHAEL
jgi:RIO kinase 1